MNIHRLLLGTVATSYLLTAQTTSHPSEQLIKPFSFLFILYVTISATLSCFAGLCSGLTVGYMSISKSEMELMANSQNQSERRIGKTILSILSNHHLLLSTLLLSNALALQALPIFLDKIVPSYLAVIISTASVVIFGQVLPQAYCTGPSKVAIGYYLAPFTRFLQLILFPFVKPITYILDNWLGHHQDKIVFTKENLRALLLLHNKKEYGYRPQEIQLLQNTLQLKSVTAKQCMIPLNDTCALDQNTHIDAQTVQQLTKWNFSKIPVYRKQKTNVIGFIKVKNLLKLNINSPKAIKDSDVIMQIIKIPTKENLLNTIDSLRNKKINFAAVVDETGACKGIITLKQIFQRITLKKFNDDDVRTGFNWNKVDQVVEAHEAREQD